MSGKHIIGHFPTPYPDELLFSLCARYSDRVQYVSKNAVCTELFGRRGTAGIIDLPRHIDYFTAKLPRGHILTANRLVLEHTLLPFYSPFLTAERVERIKESMVKPKESSTSSTATTGRRFNFTLNFLRFCPLCLESDEKLYGECYWHRSHQIPGINVCHQHAVFLEDSDLLARYRDHSSLYISAARAKVTTMPRPVDLANPEHKILLDLSQDAYWLLNQQLIVFGYEVLRKAYGEILRVYGLTSFIGNVRVSKLQAALRERYSPSSLNGLKSNFEEQKPSNWLSRFVKDLTIGKPHPPQKHLLFIRLLGHSAESFYAFCMKDKPKSACNSKPFGNGPWPCLNPVCKNFRNLIIRSCEITNPPHHNYTQCGTFTCSCGFAYARNSPDKSPKERFRYDWVKSYGAVWNNTLKDLWEDTSVTLNQMARKLCVKSETIKFRAGLLGLHFPRFGPHGSVVNITQSLLDRIVRYQRNKSEDVDLKRRTYHRKKWLENLKKHPQACRTELQQLSPGSYSWLFAHDREWFRQNQPTLRKRGTPQTDWSKLDAQYADQVRLAAQRIKNLAGRPTRVTKVSLLRDIRDQDNLIKLSSNEFNKHHRKRLPKTAKAFGEVLEPLMAYYLRKIAWAVACFRQEGVVPSFTSLSKRASIKWGKWYLPEVKAALQVALESSQILIDPNVRAA